MKSRLLALMLLLSVVVPAFAGSTSNPACFGQFPNLVTDICWDCSMPIKLFGAATINSGNQEDYDDGSIGNRCVCTPPGSLLPQAGFHTSFWEFARQIDVTRTPYCMVSLGMYMDMGIGDNAKGTIADDNSGGKISQMWFRHTHWYINPALGLMQIILDSKCLEPKSFDIAYMSEIDPTNIDEELDRILNPEDYLFGNVIAQLACSADCIYATAGFGSNDLYWCSGCNGGVFPTTGFLPASYGLAQASSLAVHKTTFKLHRMLTQWSGAGKDGMCGYYPQITMDKHQYKYSMIYPSSQSSQDNSQYLQGSGQSFDLGNQASVQQFQAQATQAQQSQAGRCCQPYGRTTIIWGSGREVPVTGEDAAYAIFRKRDCCQ